MVTLDSTFFFTATIRNWRCLLRDDQYKKIVLDTLQFLVREDRVVVFGFVIMPNHIHILWHIIDGQTKNSTQGSLLRYTSQNIKYELINRKDKELFLYKVSSKDRQYQIWKRNPLSIPILSLTAFEQKLNYIHNNPISEKWKLSNTPESYKYSSARFYENNIDDFGFLENGFEY